MNDLSTPEKARAAYYTALAADRLDLQAIEPALKAGAAAGLSPEQVRADMQSFCERHGFDVDLRTDGQKAEQAYEERRKKLEAAGTLTKGQAAFAAAVVLPGGKQSAAPSDQTTDPAERLHRSGNLSKGQAAFAAGLQLPK